MLYSEIKAATIEESKTMVLGWATALKLPVMAWQDGSLPMLVVEVCARAYQKVSQLAETLKTFTLSATAAEAALENWSDSVYKHTRLPATAAVHRLTLTCSSNSGPYTITKGSVVATDGNVTFESTDGYLEVSYPVTLASGGSVTIPVACLQAGSIGNSPAVGAINRLVTTMAGVTVSNTDTGSGTSILSSGANVESDEALRIRNASKWSTLNPFELTNDAYVYWARTVSNVRRVTVIDDNPRGEYSVDVVIAGENDTSGDSDVASVLAVLQKKLLKPFFDRLSVIAATETEITPVGNVYLKAGTNVSAARTAITDALSILAGTIPIGGTTYGASAHQLLRSTIEKALENVDCVENAVLTTPDEYTTIDQYNVVTFNVFYSSQYLNLVVLAA